MSGCRRPVRVVHFPVGRYRRHRRRAGRISGAPMADRAERYSYIVYEPVSFSWTDTGGHAHTFVGKPGDIPSFDNACDAFAFGLAWDKHGTLGMDEGASLAA